MRFAIIALVVTGIAGCGSNDQLSVSNGRVRGHVLAGPTCPVERPGDPACRPVPVAGVVRFMQGAGLAASARLDATGAFAVDLPVGKYTITVDTGTNGLPICTPVDVDAVANSDAIADVECDTGIR